ncbi:MAG TPA: N-acetyltransferase [Terriglobia bacterium]|nr:N-acetyltransferase [Terriglobia bacterium]
METALTAHGKGATTVIVEIRSERPDDRVAIREVHVRAFGDADAANLVDLLRERKKASISLVAVAGDKVVGHIMFSPITISQAPEDFRGIGLAPLAVLPEYQNRGIGSQLARAGLDVCVQGSYDVVVVLGHTSYYPRFGFSRAKDFGLDNEYNAADAFMALELKPAALRGVRGLVRYAPEFAEVGV